MQCKNSLALLLTLWRFPLRSSSSSEEPQARRAECGPSKPLYLGGLCVFVLKSASSTKFTWFAPPLFYLALPTMAM